jgi:hypothetical protein
VVQGGGGLGAINPYAVLSWGSGRRLSKKLLYLAKESKSQTIQEKVKTAKNVAEIWGLAIFRAIPYVLWDGSVLAWAVILVLLFSDVHCDETGSEYLSREDPN